MLGKPRSFRNEKPTTTKTNKQPQKTQLKMDTGTKVEANLRGKGVWLNGVIIGANEDDTYEIKYENDEVENNVDISRIRKTNEPSRSATPNILDFFEEGSRVEIDSNGNGEWAVATIINHHKENSTYDVMYQNTGNTETNIAFNKIRFYIDNDEEDSPLENDDVIMDTEEISKSEAEAKESEITEVSKSNSSPAKNFDRKRSERSRSRSPNKVRSRQNSFEEKKKGPEFIYKPMRSRIPFDITKLTYEEYVNKHYEYQQAEYQKNKATMRITGMQPMGMMGAPYGGVPTGYYGGVPMAMQPPYGRPYGAGMMAPPMQPGYMMGGGMMPAPYGMPPQPMYGAVPAAGYGGATF